MKVQLSRDCIHPGLEHICHFGTCIGCHIQPKIQVDETTTNMSKVILHKTSFNSTIVYLCFAGTRNHVQKDDGKSTICPTSYMHSNHILLLS